MPSIPPFTGFPVTGDEIAALLLLLGCVAAVRAGLRARRRAVRERARLLRTSAPQHPPALRLIRGGRDSGADPAARRAELRRRPPAGGAR